MHNNANVYLLKATLLKEVKVDNVHSSFINHMYELNVFT